MKKTNYDPNCLDGFMTVDEAAKSIDWTRQGIRKAIKNGRLPKIQKGKLFLIPKPDFLKFKRTIENGKR